MVAVNRAISAGGNDGGVETAGSAWGNNAVRDVFGASPTANYHVFLTFATPAVDTSSTIDTCVLNMRTHIDTSGAHAILSRIFCVKEANHAAPTTYAEWATDTGLLTTAVTDWDFTATDADDSAIQSDDFAAVFDEWNQNDAGNDYALGVQLNNDGTVSANNYQAIAMYDHATFTEPNLDITYTLTFVAPATIVATVAMPAPTLTSLVTVTPATIVATVAMPAATFFYTATAPTAHLELLSEPISRFGL